MISTVVERTGAKAEISKHIGRFPPLSATSAFSLPGSIHLSDLSHFHEKRGHVIFHVIAGADARQEPIADRNYGRLRGHEASHLRHEHDEPLQQDTINGGGLKSPTRGKNAPYKNINNMPLKPVLDRTPLETVVYMRDKTSLF